MKGVRFMNSEFLETYSNHLPTQEDLAEKNDYSENVPKKTTAKKVENAEQPRRTRADRRKNHIKKLRRKKTILTGYNGYNPYRGYLEYDYVDGKWKPTGNYIKYVRNYQTKTFYKNLSSRRCRRMAINEDDSGSKGNGYKRIYDLWWELI